MDKLKSNKNTLSDKKCSSHFQKLSDILKLDQWDKTQKGLSIILDFVWPTPLSFDQLMEFQNVWQFLEMDVVKYSDFGFSW